MQFVSLRDGHRRVSYLKTWELQKLLVEKVAAGNVANTILFVEHESVITRGRGLQWTGESRDRHATSPRYSPGQEEIPLVDVDRGGDLTWHGPGQLVVYPILKLDGKEAPHKDVEAVIRGYERVILSVLNEVLIQGFTEKNATGVWVKSGSEPELQQKVASIGIGVRKWTTFHGLALNVANRLESYASFQPCGYESDVMTSLEKLGVGLAKTAEWREELERAFSRAFSQVFPLLGAASSTESSEECIIPLVNVQDIDTFLEIIR
jgi:lipoyl(octanoyl) transferase